MERVKMAFEYANRGIDGKLSKHEYKVSMTALFGHCPDKWELKEIFGNSTERVVSFDEFLRWARRKGFGNDVLVNATSLPVLLDKDFKDRLKVADLCSAAKQAGLKAPRSVWLRAFREMDRRKKGFLSLDELTILISSNPRAFTH